MVNAVQYKKSVVVKISEKAISDGEKSTAKGGLSLLEAFGRKLGLWSTLESLALKRKDPRQGFTTSSVINATIHGLLSGGEGFEATEPLRGDDPLLALLGLQRAPSAETVEEVVKYLGSNDGHAGLQETTYRECSALIGRESRQDLMNSDGFVECWTDGSLLEVEGEHFESIKKMNGKRGLVVAGAFVGPYLLASDFADEGECELELCREFIKRPLKRLLAEKKLESKALVLLDSLYGDGPTLDLLEDELPDAKYVVGVNKLSRSQAEMAETPDDLWRSTACRRGWTESAVCTFWLQCDGWRSKRLCVGRRWKCAGDMVYHYAAVATNLSSDDPRVVAKMQREKLPCFEEAIWAIYGQKQALEHNWKSLLIDLGLHHPCSKKLQANAVFFAIGGLAYNLSVGVTRLAFTGASRRMRLWRLRRDVIDQSVRVARHARQVLVTLLDARDHVVSQLRMAMQFVHGM
jgi:hypothetical protein